MSKFIPGHKVERELLAQKMRRMHVEAKKIEQVEDAKKMLEKREGAYDFLCKHFSKRHAAAIIVKLAGELAKEGKGGAYDDLNVEDTSGSTDSE